MLLKMKNIYLVLHYKNAPSRIKIQNKENCVHASCDTKIRNRCVTFFYQMHYKPYNQKYNTRGMYRSTDLLDLPCRLRGSIIYLRLHTGTSKLEFEFPSPQLMFLVPTFWKPSRHLSSIPLWYRTSLKLPSTEGI